MSDEQPEKMPLTSLDIAAENRRRLRQILPAVFTETANGQGELVESIDFEKLKAELGTFSDLYEARRERYGMDWPGKKDCMKLIQQPSAATLKPCREESIKFDETGKLFIEKPVERVIFRAFLHVDTYQVYNRPGRAVLRILETVLAKRAHLRFTVGNRIGYRL